MREWDHVAECATGQSVFGQNAQLSGINLYVRLNANLAMAGEQLILDATIAVVAVPNVEYDQIVVFTGIRHQSNSYKMVVKMSALKSPGISSGWSKTVIIASEVEEDWGEADVTTFYLKTIGVSPVKGQTVFTEAYWMDTSTGFTGQVFKDSVICVGEEEAPVTGRKRV